MWHRRYLLSLLALSALAQPGASSANDRPDWSTRTCNRLLSLLNRGEPFARFAKEWDRPTLALSHQRLAWLKDRDVVLRVGPELDWVGVVGRIESIEREEGLALVQIRDLKGDLHFIVQEEASLGLIVPPNGIDRYYLEMSDLAFAHAFEHVPEAAFAKVPANRIREASRMLDFTTQSKLARTFDRLAYFGAYATAGSMVGWAMLSTLRELGVMSGSWLMQHGSNFYFGIAYLPLVQGLVRHHRPGSVRPAVAISSLTYLAYNVIEEVRFGSLGRLPGPAQGQQFTDWPDLISGAAITALFVAASEVLIQLERARAVDRKTGLLNP